MTGNRLRRFVDAKYRTMNNTKLHVGNLSFETAEIQIEDLFAEVGTVIEASLMSSLMSAIAGGTPRILSPSMK